MFFGKQRYGRRAKITFNATLSAYKGIDFDGKSTVEGERK
jgi:hypothetical protein